MKVLKSFILYLFMAIPLHAADYYMGGAGDDFANLQAAMAGMSGGDTLIIRDGTYTGASNVVDYQHLPPSGSSGAYTTIRAENTGQVIFDGEHQREMFALMNSTNRPHHIRIEGIRWRNSTDTIAQITYCDYIQIVRCSAHDTNFTGEHGGDGFVVNYSTYVLLEECWSWGSARKHFYIGNSAENIIVRRCVARHDRYSASYLDQECFMAYDCQNVEFQNCIAIDGDQGDYYLPLDITTAKAFTTRWGGSPSITVQNVFYRGCISIGNDAMLGWTGSNSTIHSIINCIHWDSAGGNRIRASGSSVDHCTFGAVTGTGTWSPLAYLEGGDTITNSLLYSAYHGIWNGVSDYNALYSITDEYVESSSAGAHDKCVANANAINPLTASLLYLPRIEPGSPLSGAGSSGDIGATILYKIGTDGTYYGDSGYNATTANALWPFPNEALIRSDMAAYTWDDGSGGEPEITGARGFCAPGKQLNGTDDITLTSYIWEYLGNPIPADIYGSGAQDTTPPTVTITTPGQTVTADSIVVEFTDSDDTGVTSRKWRIGSAPDATHGTECTSPATISGLSVGSNTIYIGAVDAAGNWGSDSITVNYSPVATTISIINSGIRGGGGVR